MRRPSGFVRFRGEACFGAIQIVKVFCFVILFLQMSKKVEDLFDLSKLSQSSIRKYQSYFRINCADSELKGKVKDHFNNQLKIDANEVIQKLLQLKREEKGVKIRGSRPSRAPL